MNSANSAYVRSGLPLEPGTCNLEPSQEAGNFPLSHSDCNQQNRKTAKALFILPVGRHFKSEKVWGGGGAPIGAGWTLAGPRRLRGSLEGKPRPPLQVPSCFNGPGSADWAQALRSTGRPSRRIILPFNHQRGISGCVNAFMEMTIILIVPLLNEAQEK